MKSGSSQDQGVAGGRNDWSKTTRTQRLDNVIHQSSLAEVIAPANKFQVLRVEMNRCNNDPKIFRLKIYCIGISHEMQLGLRGNILQYTPANW